MIHKPSRCNHRYRVYGLTLATNIELPGLEVEKVAGQAADIEINMGFFTEDIQHHISQPSEKYHVEHGNEGDDSPHLIVTTLTGGKYFHFFYDYGVEFVFDQSATTVWGRWNEPLVLEDAILYLLGPIIGFMLRLRGVTCLHASSVVVEGNAFALTGPSGAGKSTLAASFAASGYAVLSDDVLPLIMANDAIYAQPGYSRLRLFPKSFENLPGIPDKLPLLAPGWDKCYLDLSAGNFTQHTASAPLKVIYIIDWGAYKAERPSIKLLTSATEAVPLLAVNTYRQELLTREMRMNEFQFLSQLASIIMVKKLYPVDDVLTVSHLREMLLKDFHEETKKQRQKLPYKNIYE